MRLLDTSVIVDHLRGFPPAVALIDSLLEEGEAIAAPEVVRFELLAGVQEGQRDSLERFFDSISWVPIDEAVARAAAILARQHRPAFSGIDDVDFLIAGAALVLGAPILTRNVRHFPMFPGLSAPY